VGSAWSHESEITKFTSKNDVETYWYTLLIVNHNMGGVVQFCAVKRRWPCVRLLSKCDVVMS